MGRALKENSLLIDRVISECAAQVASHNPDQAQVVEESRRQSDPCEAALRQLFDRLEAFLPQEAKSVPSISPEMVRERVRPMVFGLLPPPWRTVALRELGIRWSMFSVTS